MYENVGDPCAENPCLNGAACISNGYGGFTCQCPPGYSGQRCEGRKTLSIFIVIAYSFVSVQVILVLLNHA
jgi:hypothetical protein